eukprot:CAMPEP_0119550828 /NCGR_PEP_ID=MMETSP1352-20130426/4276_1 /TAXON_ID=265584 /ORGANISM="Stauroneis constricta, Strain CCMP1120" /LENGTH=179 /DNA_ID=CAMNT_0007596797 /DNA_START=334 /DNA_END=873 /DNA_ORIENTATION=-
MTRKHTNNTSNNKTNNYNGSTSQGGRRRSASASASNGTFGSLSAANGSSSSSTRSSSASRQGRQHYDAASLLNGQVVEPLSLVQATVENIVRLNNNGAHSEQPAYKRRSPYMAMGTNSFNSSSMATKPARSRRFSHDATSSVAAFPSMRSTSAAATTASLDDLMNIVDSVLDILNEDAL